MISRSHFSVSSFPWHYGVSNNHTGYQNNKMKESEGYRKWYQALRRLCSSWCCGRPGRRFSSRGETTSPSKHPAGLRQSLSTPINHIIRTSCCQEEHLFPEIHTAPSRAKKLVLTTEAKRSGWQLLVNAGNVIQLSGWWTKPIDVVLFDT